MKKTLLCIALALVGFSSTSYADEGYASLKKAVRKLSLTKKH